jgi:hypothetical protein
MRLQKLIMAVAWVCAATFAQAGLVFLEQFDGTGYGYLNATQGATILTDTWADFQNRLTDDVMSGGVISGKTPNAQSAQIRSFFDLGLDATKVTNITVRLRIDINNDGQWNDVLTNGSTTSDHFNLYYARQPYTNETNIAVTQLDTNPGVTLTITSQAEGWSVWSMSFAEGALTGNLKSLRLDMRGSGTAVPFELDSVAIYAIPEPATLGMLGLGAMIAAVIRRSLKG